MRSRGREYLASADVLRVISIGLVGWYHIWQQSWLEPGFVLFGRFVDLQSVVRHGYLMVDIILVISGFLLSLPYARSRLGLGERPGIRDFYLRRFWRIFPSYFLAIALCLFLWVLPGQEYSSTDFLLKDLITHFTFTHNLSYETYFATPLPVVLWTLGVEVQFYVLFPLVGRAFEKSPPLTCLGLTLTAAVVRLRVSSLPDTTVWVNQLPCMLDLYACGMAAGYLYVLYADRCRRPALQWALAGCALLSLLIILQLLYRGDSGDYRLVRLQQLSFRLPLGMAAGTFLVCGALGPPALSRALGNPITRFLAAISYNFYIWHQTLAVRLKLAHIPPYSSPTPNKDAEQPWMTRYTLLCFAAAIAVSALITFLWERPCFKWGLKLTAGELPRGGPAEPPSAPSDPEAPSPGAV